MTSSHILVGFVLVLLHDTGILCAAINRAIFEAATIELKLRIGGIDLAIEQRRLAVLVTAQVALEGKSAVRRVLVERCVGTRADENEAVAGEAHKNHENAQNDVAEYTRRHFLQVTEQIHAQRYENDDGNQQARPNEGDARQQNGHHERNFHACLVVAFLEFPQAPGNGGEQHNRIEDDARVVAHTQCVHKEAVEVAAQFHKTRFKTVENHAYNGKRYQQCDNRTFGIGVLGLAEVINKCNGGDTQQVEQVHAQRETEYIGYEYNPAVARRRVGAVLPLEYEPEHQSSTETREGIHLGLNCREPEGVAPSVNKCSAQAATHHHQVLGKCHLIFLAVFHHEPLHQVRDGPEQQQNGGRAQQGRHGVDALRHRHHIATGKACCQAGNEYEDGVAGRVADFHFISLSNKFGAIPEASCGFDGEQVGNGCYQECEPAERVVDNVVFSHLNGMILMLFA